MQMFKLCDKYVTWLHQQNIPLFDVEENALLM